MLRPSDLDFDFSVPFVFVNETDSEAGMAIWKVPDGTTVEDVAVDGIVGIADRRGMVDASAGESATVSVLLDVVLLDVPGDWLINCFAEDDYPALIFQVFDEASDSSQHSG